MTEEPKVEANATPPTANVVVDPPKIETEEPKVEETNVEINQRVLEESIKNKKRAQVAEQALKDRDTQDLKEQNKFKELYERSEADKGLLAKKMLKDRRHLAITNAAAKHGCVDTDAASLLGDSKLLQYDEEKDAFVGVDQYFEDLKATKPYLFNTVKPNPLPRPGGIIKDKDPSEMNSAEYEAHCGKLLAESFKT